MKINLCDFFRHEKMSFVNDKKKQKTKKTNKNKTKQNKTKHTSKKTRKKHIFYKIPEHLSSLSPGL